MKPPCFECLTLPICKCKNYKGIKGLLSSKVISDCSIISQYIMCDLKTSVERIGKVEEILKGSILLTR